MFAYHGALHLELYILPPPIHEK